MSNMAAAILRVAVPVLVAAALGQAAGAAPRNAAAEADEVRALMEGVRAQTEESDAGAGRPSAARSAAAAMQARSSVNWDAGLDKELMDQAGRIEKEMRDGGLVAAPALRGAPAATSASSKRAVLMTSSDQSSGHDGAARFFAAHGMAQIGRLLGHELSDEAAKKAAEEAAAARRRFGEEAAAPVTAEMRTQDASGANTDFAADFAADEEQDRAEEKKRWEAVDKLRRRHALHV